MEATVQIEGRTYATGVELLGVDVICGIRVPIIRATPEQVPGLAEEDGAVNDGYFCGRTTTIYLRHGQPETQERDTLNHERGHAFVQLSGLKNILEAAVTWPKGYDAFEEAIVRVAAPHLSTFQSLDPESK